MYEAQNLLTVVKDLITASINTFNQADLKSGYNSAGPKQVKSVPKLPLTTTWRKLFHLDLVMANISRV